MTVQRKLTMTLIIIFSLIVAAVFGMSTARRAYIRDTSQLLHEQMLDQISKEVDQNLIAVSQSLAYSLFAVINEKKETLRTAASTVQAFEAEQAYDVLGLRDLAVSTRVDIIEITDDTGTVISSTEPEDIGDNILLKFSGFDLILKSQVKLFPSEVFYNIHQKGLYMSVAIPRKEELGIVNVMIDVSEIEDIMFSFVNHLKGFHQISLIDDKHTVLSSYSKAVNNSNKQYLLDQDETLTEVYEHEEMRILLQDELVSIYYPVNSNGMLRYVLKIELEIAPYMVASEISQEGIDKMAVFFDNQERIELTVILLVVTLGVLAMGLGIRKFLSPLKDMVAATEAISKGDLSIEHTSQSSDEIGRLSESFNMMIRDLRKMTFDIRESSKALQSSAADIQSSVISVSYVNGEINFAIDNMALGAVSQVEESSETLIATRELSSNLTFIRQSLAEMVKMMASVATDAKNIENDFLKGDQAQLKKSIGHMNETITLLLNNTINMNREADLILSMRTRVLDAIENISTVSEEAAAFIEEVTASVEEQNQEIHKVVTIVEELNVMADDLVGLVDQYTL